VAGAPLSVTSAQIFATHERSSDARPELRAMIWAPVDHQNCSKPFRALPSAIGVAAGSRSATPNCDSITKANAPTLHTALIVSISKRHLADGDFTKEGHVSISDRPRPDRRQLTPTLRGVFTPAALVTLAEVERLNRAAFEVNADAAEGSSGLIENGRALPHPRRRG
jgi:hypothetical protein